MKTNRLTLPSIAAWLAASLTAAADSVTTAFNYQARLNHNNAPAQGPFDLKFELYNVAAGGAPVTEPIVLAAYNVQGGLFSVPLNFGGPALFDGTAYWLATSARVAGGGGNYLPASDRVPLRITPYAIHSLRAASVKDGTVTTSSLAPGAVTSAKLATGAVGPGQLNAAGAPGAGQLLAYNGTGLSWITPPGGGGGGGPWLMSGVNAYYNNGKVGVGTASPASPITVQTIGSSYGVEHTNGTVRLSTFTGGDAITAGWLGTISNHPLSFFVNNQSSSMTIATDGNVGIGTTVPSARLEISGQNAIRVGGYQPVITLDDTNTDFLLGSGTRIQCVDGQMVFQVQSNFDGVGWPYLAKAKIDTAGLTIFGDISTNATIYTGALHSGNASVSTLTIRGGADLAEPFAMSESGVEPGSVVVIDTANPGKLKLSTRAYDKKVAGIVSGANGIQPGISMIQEDNLEAGENVALSGRVYVKADTMGGPIEAGDLLTSSSTAGHAMKAANHEKAHGAIIGKAMTGLDAGDGMVLVLVTLQ